MAVTDIVIAPAVLWYAATGEALPDETTVAADASWGGTWASLGKTLEAVTLTVEMEPFDLYVDQLPSPVRRTVTGKRAAFKAVLAELTGTNLALALDGTKTTTAAGAAQKGYDSIAVAADSDLTVYAVGIETYRISDAGVKQPIRVFFPRATIRQTGDSAITRTGAVGLPIEVDALASMTDGSLFTIHNVTAPASS